ncbi:hypothetical protein V5799_014169 [Amblyomma americanum]|uniref:ABC-2 type transporter transmembrane domain-containing protein n=1 Tax=Amblyomma americanum TaxID=6943 RepID=A0AAQ4E3U0_AMBAM
MRLFLPLHADAFAKIFARVIEGWYNPASPVACSVLLNLIDTAMLRAASQSSRARITAGVSFYGKKKSARPVTTEAQKQRLEDLIGQIGTNMLFWYSLAPSLVCMAVCPVVFFPIAEKLCGARELQLMTGISGPLYVASHFLFDLLFHYLVPFSACFAIYSFWYADLEFTTVVAVYVIVLAFAPVAIFEAYLLAHFLHSEAGAFTCALVVFVIGGNNPTTE